ncbi:hypothetical protein BKA64DRAFT_763361 [Cadophora sp. MPI-SDFR-AT-0126]|nr:hypothetical protein BKA64DRAFT_763361 [Leotiomycetes sp. MPI-SDFR-AT-0126]
MDIIEEFAFLLTLGLKVAIFGKDLKKSRRRSKQINLFIIVTQSGDDELCYNEVLPEGEWNRLSNWIRCGDRTGLAAEWKELDVVGNTKFKVYLAGENPGIDCSAVMSEMFFNKDGRNYTYIFNRETGQKVQITHPQHEISLGRQTEIFWRTAKNFSDLITLDRKFLLGQIPETPYHHGQIFEETIPLVPGLLKLHDFGLFTIDSQPSGCGVDKRDIAYLEFFEKLKERADIVVHAQELCPFRIVEGSHDRHVVTRERKANNKKDLETTEWKPLGSVCSNRSMAFLVSKYFPAMKQDKPVYFDVAAYRWGVQLDVLKVIEEVMIGLGWPLISDI